MSEKERRDPPSSPDPERDETEVPIEQGEAAEVVEAVEAGEEPVARVEVLEDRIKRLQAEFLNETKRIQRQADEGRKYAVEGLVADLIPVFDALHSAREGLGAEGETTTEAVRQGLDLVEKQFLSVLGRHGVERIEATDAPFDPGLHEAVYVVDDPEREPNVVAQVLRPGFTLNGRVVRPAHVAVTRQPGADA